MEIAIIKEINKEYLEAVKCYEYEINNCNISASLESYINLAFIYWNFAFDLFGFNEPNNIPDDFSIIGGNRYSKILDLGLNNYPNSVELNFWKKYFSHIIFGEEFSEQDCWQLINKYGSTDSLVPYFFLYLFNKESYKEKKIELINECNKQPTVKNLYIKSILS